jgi:hypothetical protein
MARFVQLVLTNPVEGEEEEFNRWYTEDHIPDVLGVDGILSAQRLEYIDSLFSEGCQFKYAAIYEVEADNLEAATTALSSALRESGRMRSSKTLDRDFRQWYFSPMGEKATAG